MKALAMCFCTPWTHLNREQEESPDLSRISPHFVDVVRQVELGKVARDAWENHAEQQAHEETGPANPRCGANDDAEGGAADPRGLRRETRFGLYLDVLKRASLWKEHVNKTEPVAGPYNNFE